MLVLLAAMQLGTAVAQGVVNPRTVPDVLTTSSLCADLPEAWHKIGFNAVVVI